MYAGFYVLQVLLAFFSVGSFRWEVLMLAAVSYPIYVKAFVNALVGREQQWHVTGGTTRSASPFNFMVPQVLTFAFLAMTGAVGVWQNLVTGRFTLGTAWCVTNAVVLGAFLVVALGESRRSRRPARSARHARLDPLPGALPPRDLLPSPRRPEPALVARHAPPAPADPVLHRALDQEPA